MGRNIEPNKWFSEESIEEAFKIAAASSKSISDALYASGNESAAEVSIATSLSFEQVFKASLGIDDSEGRGGRPSVRKER